MSRDAYANGRFPQAQQIALAPRGADPNLIVLRTTFGIVVSHDAGKTWSWICEAALGFTGEWDPPVAITKDGKIWVGLPDGLRSTRDGCSSDDISAFHGERVTDLAVDGSGENLIVLTSPLERPAHVSIVHAKGNVERIGGEFSGFQLTTVESAPSSEKLYVSGAPFGKGPRPHLFVGAKGKPLVEAALDLPEKANVFVSAVDPKNDARLVIRTLAPEGSDIYISNDGGKTFVSTLHVPTLLYGFAKSEDGKTLFTGSGDPNDGIFRSEDRGQTWKPISKTPVRCLALAGPNLYACSTPYLPSGFAIAMSTDGASTFATLNAFTDIGGPIACDGGAGAVCGAAWPAQKALLNPKPRDAGAAIDGSANDVDGSVMAPTERPSRGCGCVAAGEENSGLSPLLLSVLMAGLLIARMDHRKPSLSRSRSMSAAACTGLARGRAEEASNQPVL